MSILTEMRALLESDGLKFKTRPGSALLHSKGWILKLGKKLFRVVYVDWDDSSSVAKFSLLPVTEKDVLAGTVDDDYTREIVKKLDKTKSYEVAIVGD
jgi:hypothetical protein